MTNLSNSILLHCSNANIGGAERSLLSEIRKSPHIRRFFVLPAEGPLSSELKKADISYVALAWPWWINWFTQHQLWWKWPLFLLGPLGIFSLSAYLKQLKVLCKNHQVLISSGVKSHCLLLFLAPLYGNRMIFDIRDFVEPLLFRRLLSLLIRVWGIKVQANSRAVGRDYPAPSVKYPEVTLSRPVQDRRRTDGIVTITHAAYYAPYKGQDLFLHYARQILDAREKAEFWLAGDVIYPGRRYYTYKKKLLGLIRELKLESHVKVWGEVKDLQSLLEHTHVLLHCTRDPEPFGRVVMEGLLCGCEVVCHKQSGVCEVLKAKQGSRYDLGIELGEEYLFVENTSNRAK